MANPLVTIALERALILTIVSTDEALRDDLLAALAGQMAGVGRREFRPALAADSCQSQRLIASRAKPLTPTTPEPYPVG
jgi:hypothetical protein